jgi:hypothetical protein
MTARRNDTGTALRKGFARPAARTAPTSTAPTPTTEPAPAPATKGKPPMTKYTALLTLDDADKFDELAKAARRRVGRAIGKADLMRALILLAADDASVKEQVIDQAAVLDAEARASRGR